MQSKTRRNLRILHGWWGVIIACGLFLMGLTGGLLAISDPYLANWTNPPLHEAASVNAELLQARIADIVQSEPGQYEEIEIRFPGDGHDRFIGILLSHLVDEPEKALPSAVEYLVDPVEYSVYARRVGQKGDLRSTATGGVIKTLTTIHHSLFLPAPLSYLVLAALGLSLSILAFSGFLFQTNPFKNFWQVRHHLNPMVFLKDLHRLVGMISLPALAVLSVSGVLLSIGLNLVLPVSVLVMAEGDTKAAVQAVLPPVRGKNNDVFVVPSLDLALAAFSANAPQGAPNVIRGGRIVFENLGALDAGVKITGPGGTLPCGSVQSFGAYSAIPNPSECVLGRGDDHLIGGLPTLMALHRATFGGAWIDFIWLLFGLGLAGLAWSGAHTWLETHAKRLQKDAQAFRSRQRLHRVVSSALGSFVLSVALLLMVSPWVHKAPWSQDQTVWISGFLSVWLVSGCAAFFLKSVWRHQLVLCASIVFFGTAAAHLPFGPHAGSLLSHNALLAAVFCLLALMMIGLARWAPARREE